MARYIDADKFECVILHEDIEIAKHKCKDFESYIGGAEQFRFQVKNAISKQPTADVVKVVRCKDCDVPHNKWTGCPNLNGLIPPPNFYCAKGTPKERGADKPKVTCLNCKHLEITLPYGECSRQLRIVNPDDTCEYAEPKERGGEK